MHKVMAKSILSSDNGMNIYRGCTHGCIYCDSRSTCYQMNHEFEDIEIKENALILLEDSLKRKRTKCMIGTGSMSDPYMPLEKSIQYTRRCLELIEHYEYGAAIQTKSDLILRDIDLLKKINQKSKCVVQITLTTYNEELCRILEPNVCTTRRRSEVLNILRDEGIPTIVWLCPILPFINDTLENIEGLLNYCIEANTYGIINFGMGVTMRDGDRQYFYKMLDRHFPGIKNKYIQTFGNSYELSSPNFRILMKSFTDICHQHNIIIDNNRLFHYLHTYQNKTEGRQLSLFDDEYF